jgi:DUF1680 family protein
MVLVERVHLLFIAIFLMPSFFASAQVPPNEALKSFTYADVKVIGGPMGAQAKAARQFYLSLDEDSLLQGFRLRAGLPAPGRSMGGWYDPDDKAGGHSFGQYLSALARMYANTGDIRFKKKVSRLVHGFHVTMDPDGYFYASAKAGAEWPCYIYDKNAAGMRDAYTLAGNSEALIVLDKMTDWAEIRLPRRSDEWYTLPEGLYLSYRLTREPRYLKMAAEFDYSQDFFDIFRDGTNAFTPDRQAYSHVNSLVSAAQTYETWGDPVYLSVIENAWNFLTETQMYASGGWGPGEHFVNSGQLGSLLKTEPRDFETPCGSYANMNLNRYLIRFTGQSKYGDDMERVLLNGMLAALPMGSRGRTFYYSNYQAGAKKEYYESPWPCCSGTYAQITADYPLNLYFHDDTGIYVNLYAPSLVHWSMASGEFTIEQKTKYPLSDRVSIFVHGNRAAEFSLHLRVPKWVKAGASVSINSQRQDLSIQPNTFLTIEREWHDGDRVDFWIPRSLHFQPIDSFHPDRAALMYGPLMLVALVDHDVTLYGNEQRPSDWIKPFSGPSEFVAPHGIVFRPFYLLRHEHYTTYPRIKSPQGESAY